MGYAANDIRKDIKADLKMERNMTGKEITVKIKSVANIENAKLWEESVEKYMFVTDLLEMDEMYSPSILDNAVARLENRLEKLLNK